MDTICCISYNPFILLEHNRKIIKTYHYIIKSFHKLEHSIKYNIYNILYKDYLSFFIISNEYIYESILKENKIIEKDKIYIGNDDLKYSIYDKINERIYGFTNSNIDIYCLKKKKKLYRVYNGNKIIIDKVRYYHFPKKDFLLILQSLHFCIFSTKKHLKKCCSLLWEYKKSLDFQWKGFFRDKYIFILKNEMITIHRNTFLMEIYGINDYILDNSYRLLFSYFLYLITYSHEGNTLKLNYYRYNGIHFTYLFYHEIFLSHQYRIDNLSFYSFQDYHFIFIETKNKENKFLYLFHFHEKMSEQILIENENNLLYKKQIDIYHSILYKNEIKITNDVLKRELSKCCICYENNVSILFLPCGHICCCYHCIYTMEKCPLCRESILYKKFCYILTN